MNLLRRFWRWFTTPSSTYTPEQLRELGQTEQRLMAQDHENERKMHLATLPEPPDLSDDPDTDVPPPHPGQTQHVDLTKARPRGEQAPTRLADVTPSDFDLLSPEEQQLFTELGHDPAKTIQYPAPAEQSTQEWVTERLAKAGYSEAYHLRFMAFRRVAVGMSMRHLGDLKRRAEDRDTSLTVHDLIALRSRGIC